MELEPIVHAAHESGGLVVVDDFHGTGVLPLDVHEAGIDILLTGCLKWLCGGQGLAFLYCRRELIQRMQPLIVGWFGTKDPFDFDRSELRLRDDARRFETGTYALPQAWTASGGLEIISDVGVDKIRARSIELTTRLIEFLQELELEILSPLESDRRGGLVRVRIPGGRKRADAVLHELFARDVVLDSRNDSLRISPHFFNDEDDLERCVNELRRVLSEVG